MARITVEDCLKRIPNRFFLVQAATKRVRQLLEGSPRLVEAEGNEDVVAALREIAAGKVFVTENYTNYLGQKAEKKAEKKSEQPAE